MTDIRKAIAIAAMLAAPFSAAADTEYTTYSTESAFTTDVDVIASDDFNDLDLGYTEDSIDRSLEGGFSYSFDAQYGLWVFELDPVRTDRNYTLVPAVSPNDLVDDLDMTEFNTQISAIGGYFYNTDFDFATMNGSIELLVELAIGDALSFTLSNIAGPTFWGIEVEDDYITHFTMNALTPNAFPTVGELFFGSVYEPDPVDPGADDDAGGGTGPVNAPAPAALALLLLGLAGMVQLRRRTA